ncbi:hypothetical protein EZJ43_07835 [Pedobacter changchengzhani]|uniref:Uncharacterized protein n=1 Tax=Pedobacter changchengzhani TaxID=2529274 RepID=A0A4R5ML50_9SPHI|nr:hypothetical protein [Pedobacter changchengzhani]TDG36420.1 hypothetical protein EZJ43_07835 [Pedobacter changchengzhani]
MRYLFIILTFVSVSAFGQKKPTVVKSKTSKQEANAPIKTKSYLFGIRKAFSWQITTDQKLLPANKVFKENIQFEYDLVTIEENFKDEPFDFNSTIKPDENGVLANPSFISKTLIYRFEVKNDLLILTETDSKAVKKFKIFFNKNKEPIRLQSLTTKRVYNPTAFKGSSKSM